MKRCAHSSWLSLREGDEATSLRQTSVLNDIVASFETPADTFPSLVIAVGRAGDFLPRIRQSRRLEPQDGMRLVLDPNTAFSDHPMLFASGNFAGGRTLDANPTMSKCHRHTTRELQWKAPDPCQVADVFYGGLIRPFADVVCFHAVDSDGIRRAADDMLPWLDASKPWSCRASPRPRLLLIVTSDERRSPAAVQAQLLEAIEPRSQHPRAVLASLVSVHVQRGSARTAIDRIESEAKMAQQARVRSHFHLNAVHFDRLFQLACDHFVNTVQTPFDALAASRSHRPVRLDLHTHLADLLTAVDSYEDMSAFAAPFAAECLVLDNYAHDVPCW